MHSFSKISFIVFVFFILCIYIKNMISLSNLKFKVKGKEELHTEICIIKTLIILQNLYIYILYVAVVKNDVTVWHMLSSDAHHIGMGYIQLSKLPSSHM